MSTTALKEAAELIRPHLDERNQLPFSACRHLASLHGGVPESYSAFAAMCRQAELLPAVDRAIKSKQYLAAVENKRRLIEAARANMDATNRIPDHIWGVLSKTFGRTPHAVKSIVSAARKSEQLPPILPKPRLKLAAPRATARERIEALARELGPRRFTGADYDRIATQLKLPVRRVIRAIEKARDEDRLPRPLNKPVELPAREIILRGPRPAPPLSPIDESIRDLDLDMREVHRRYTADRGNLGLIAAMELLLREWRMLTGHTFWVYAGTRYRLDGAGELVRERITQPAMRCGRA